MSDRFVLPLESCSDPVLVGGKAAGLGRLLRSGFHVPRGVCLTTLAYSETLQSVGGLYRSILGVPRSSIATAIVECWASLWTLAAQVYRSRTGRERPDAAMAVILQPLLSPRAAGVAYSRHPVTAQDDLVVINAVFGLAEPLVGGAVTPDQYVVKIGNDEASGTVLERDIAEKTTARIATPT